MRIWSLHPQLLDRAGLVACWRETLLAQAVLAGRTKGYRNHPQLDRFRASPDARGAVVAYLRGLAEEADARGYRFDRTRIDDIAPYEGRLEVSDGQLQVEYAHLLAKVEQRAGEHAQWLREQEMRAHPLFRVVAGPRAEWERS